MRGNIMSYVYLTENNIVVSKKGGRFIVSRNHETVMELPIETIEGMIIFETVQISSATVVECLEKDIPITWLSNTGKFFGRLESTKHINVQKHYNQMLLQEEGGAYFELAKRIIKAKIDNQIVLLRRYSRNSKDNTLETDIKNIYAVRRNVFCANNVKELMGFEGYIARIYFYALGKIVPEEFRFKGRSKQPPKDPFNSMLSFGYTLVMYELYTLLINYGLHPYFGFIHSLRTGHPALASDLIEEWRAVLVDAMVLSLVQHNEIHLSDFNIADSGGVFLKNDSRRIFLKAYERKMRSLNSYIGMKKSFRETLAIQVENFSKAIMTKDLDSYEPLKIR